MRKILFDHGRFAKHHFVVFSRYLCVRSNMATRVEPNENRSSHTEAAVCESNDRDVESLVSKREVEDEPEDWKAKRRKQEEADGEMMISRKEQGLPFRKKKVGMLMMYCGKDYYGMQVQRHDKTMIVDTIESDLFQALHKAGVITEEHARDTKAMKFQRAARTDKGVSAAGQMFSEIENPADKINENLPPQIRILGITRATKSFDSKNHCDSRTYSYLLPTYALAPVEEHVVETFRIKEETLKKTNEILSLYKGTHNFHNYTSGKKPSDPSARRYITDMKIGSPFVQNGLEFASITVKGQSFMLHQIRKMIGLMIAVIRGLASISAIEKSWLPVRRDVPKAPGLGLMLEEVHYGSYNKRYSKTHDPIKFDQYKEEIEKFKKEHIYKVMIETEKAEKSMMQWLATLHLHHFGETTSDFPVTAETALGKAMGNLIKAEKSQEDVESETVCGKDESSGQRAHTESDSIPPEKQCDSSQVDVMESLQGSDSPCTDSQRTDNPLCQMKEKDESAKSPLKSNSTNQSQPTVST